MPERVAVERARGRDVGRREAAEDLRVLEHAGLRPCAPSANSSGSPNAPNSAEPNVVISAICPPSHAQDVELERAEHRSRPAGAGSDAAHGMAVRPRRHEPPLAHRRRLRDQRPHRLAAVEAPPGIGGIETRMSSRMSAAAADQSPLSCVAMKPCSSRCSSSLSSGALGVVLRQPLAQRRPGPLQRAVGRRRRSARGSPPSRPPTTRARRAARAPRAGAPAAAGSRRCTSARSSRARRRRRPAPPRSARPRRAAGPGRAAATAPRALRRRRAASSRRSASRHTLVAILYSHARRPSPPAKLSRAFHARRNASCSASSASSKEPSIR